MTLSSLVLIALPIALGALRSIIDQREVKTVALPAAGGSADSGFFFIGTGSHVEDMEVQILLPATPSLADAHTITLTLQDSADGVTGAALIELAPVIATGAGGTGAAAIKREVRLPSSFRGWLRLHADVQSAGGDNTAITATMNLLH